MRKIIMYTIMLLMIIIAPFYAVGQALDQTYIDYYNPLLNGATCNSATFQAAITAIGTAQKTLYLTATDRNKAECIWSITTSITVPSNIRLFIPFGITATINPGITLLANGCIDADDPQWFSGGGTVTQASACAAQAQQFSAAQESSFTQENCYHGTAVGTTGTITSCTAYIRTGSGAGALHSRIAFLTSTALLYTEGDGDYFTLLRSDFGVTPGGWTCLASTPYCWMKSPTKPSLPANTMFILHVVLAGGSITLSEDISYRIIAGIYQITSATRIGIDGTWDVRPLGRIDIASTIVLSNAGCIRASVESVFINTGTIVYQAGARCTTVYGEWWGALGNNIVQGQEVFFQRAMEALKLSGGRILGAGPGAIYAFSADWNIIYSNITLDGQGATFTSTAIISIRAWDQADQSDSGETSQFIENVHLLNYNIGTDSSSTNQMRGGRLYGCKRCSIQNVFLKTSQGTGFTLFRCQECLVANIRIEHGSTDGLNFCTLLVHTNNSIVKDWTCTGAGQGTGACCSDALQMKGGISNKFMNITIANMTNPTGLQRAIWSRGDDPWSPSATNPVTEPYPFLTNPQAPAGQQDCKLNNCYLSPDARRASIDTEWANMSVMNTPSAICFGLQEAHGDKIVNLTCENTYVGVTFVQSLHANAGEKGFSLQNFRIRNMGTATPLGNGDGVFGIYVNGAGSESADSLSVARRNFNSIAISNGSIENTAGQGVLITDAFGVTISNVSVNDASRAGGTQKFGIHAIQSEALALSNNVVMDLKATPTITSGIRITELDILPTIVGNSVRCPNCAFGTFNFIRSFPVGRISNNNPAFCTARTTTATPDVTRCVVLTKSGDRLSMKTSCAARSATNRAYYERTVIAEESAGTVTVYPNTGTGDTTFESDPTWDMDIVASGGEVRPRLTGASGQTIDWFCDVELIPTMP